MSLLVPGEVSVGSLQNSCFSCVCAQLWRGVRLLLGSQRGWAAACVFPSYSPGASLLFRWEIGFP